MADKDLVVITGVTGFIGGYCAMEALRRGYRVRGTLRSRGKVEATRGMLRRHVTLEEGDLEFATVDLTRDDGWADAMRGARYVLHVASPFPLESPKDADELVRPAVDGTRRARRAASDAGVERVVLTSSFAAVGFGHGDVSACRVFTEREWTNPDGGKDVSPYILSKTMAEKAAWDFTAEHDGAPELTSINPTLVIGPILGAGFSSSVEVVRQIVAREVPALPKLGFGVVDVRDVAWAHCEAMECEEAAGERFLCSTGFMWMQDMGEVLAEYLKPKGYNIPTMGMPGFMLRMVALVNPPIRQVTTELGQHRVASRDKIDRVLGYAPLDLKQSLRDTADSLIAHGVVS
ncbi:MAG: NAD-dependent epimerase/dehydratase family protein [Myxococcota bacterium]